MAKTTSLIDKILLRCFSPVVRMEREGERRVYLELKRRQMRDVLSVVIVLQQYGITHFHQMALDNKKTPQGTFPYYRHRLYVYGKEAFKVFDLIDWDFEDEEKNRKLKVIRGLYKI